MKPLRFEAARRFAIWFNRACAALAVLWAAAWVGLALEGRKLGVLESTALSVGWLPFMMVNLALQSVLSEWDIKRQDAFFREVESDLNSERDRIRAMLLETRENLH